MLQMSGGTYTDEATGTSITMQPGDVMTSVMPQAFAGAVMGGVQITPLTSMAQVRAQTMSGGMTPANIAAANTAMGNYFSVNDILYTHPIQSVDPRVGKRSNARHAQLWDYVGCHVAVRKQYRDAVLFGYRHHHDE